MKKRIIALLLTMCLLSSCSFEIRVEDMLTSPTLTKTQKEINNAISSAVGSDSYHLIFPQNGNHLSACTLYDVDSDGKDEAIAFYELTSNAITSTWICFLRQTNDGTWTTVKQIPGQANIVDRIDFINILNPNMYSIFVGWKNSGSVTTGCFYSITSNDITRIDKQYAYNDLISKDINFDDKQELLLLDTNNSCMNLLEGKNEEITVSSTITLQPEIVSIVNLQAGMITTGLNGVLCDVLLSSGKIDTIIGLINDDENKSTIELISCDEITPFSSLEREQKDALCCDFNDDGFLDIVLQEPMLGYERSAKEDTIYLTKYYSIIDGELKLVGRAIINEKDGYSIRIPDTWIDKITVYEDGLQNEWVVKYYDGTVGIENQNEILAIRTRSVSEYKDIFDDEVYETVLIRGTAEYQIRLPNNAPVGFNLKLSEAKELVTLN